MRKATFIVLALLALGGIYAFHAINKVIDRKMDDIFSLFGITEGEGKEFISSSFFRSYLSHPNTTAYKALPSAKRVEVTKGLFDYVRRYVLSENFLALYSDFRKAQLSNINAPLTPDQQMKQFVTDQKKSVTEAEESLKSVPASIRPEMEKMVAELKRNVKLYEDPSSAEYKMMFDMQKQSYASEVEEHRQAIDEFNRKYPASVKEMVADRLQTFMKYSEGIDFNAKLIDGPNGKKLFEDPELEQKPREWKMCFRAGPEVIPAIRASVTGFLAELKK